MSTIARGRISVNPRGFGFLKVAGEAGEVTAFVIPPDLNPLLDGDVAEATLTTDANGRTTASALKLVERTRRELFGVVVKHGRALFLKVDRLVANTDWPFEEGAKDLVEGAYVVGEIRGAVVAPTRVLAASYDVGVERVIVRHGLRSTYSDALQAEARAAASKRREGPRRDLRDVPTVTIDAPSTLDLDDALAILPATADGAMRVLVSIADVDAYVAEGSPLDVEARARATSVYLAGRVLPMLPDVLSTGAISLNEGQDRLALTAELRIDAEGAVRAVDLYTSTIRSHARLSYDGVAAYLANGAVEGVPEGVRPTVRWLRTAAARLGAVRVARGGVSLAREEASVSLDPNTHEPLDVTPRAENDAHRLVERLMVAANEAVAAWLVDRGLPGLFRVHDQPTPERVAMLTAFAENFGIETGFGPELTPRGLAAFEAQYRGTSLEPAMASVVGRTLGSARYTVHPAPHFGLAAALYLHFTSPIRRYADLVVHRVVKRYLAGQRDMTAGDSAFEAIAEHVNRVAFAASKAETERHRMLVARLFAHRIGEAVGGRIVSVQPFGLVVQIDGTGATGTVAIDALPGAPHKIDLARQEVVGSAATYAVGQPFAAKISATNEDLGRVDLVPA